MTSRLQTRLTCHRFYQPLQDSGRGERAGALRRERISHPEYRSRARGLQREVKARVREFRNESWSDHGGNQTIPQSVWAVTKGSKPRDIPYTPPKPDNSVAIDDAEIAECLADSIETQCSHFPPHDIAHISRIEKKVLQNFPRTKDDLAPVSLSEVQTLVKSLNTRKAPGPRCDHLLGKGLIIDEQFGFRPAHSCPARASPPLSRQTDISHLGMSALTRQDVLSEQEFLKAPPSLLYLAYKRCTATVAVWRPTRVIRGRYRALYGNRLEHLIHSPPRGPLTS
ncbi:hypothetical protein EVAR_91907_1 [Eumeta japonica]|uniref:Uncharacterized protein n=1 Tax=Eumeta variegata TaxID=151549 RepID=A0A4C1SYJ8_EUMVA|nr:hypothetical protein EVAR_91907_1 [Eumeta japonica]